MCAWLTEADVDSRGQEWRPGDMGSRCGLEKEPLVIGGAGCEGRGGYTKETVRGGMGQGCAPRTKRGHTAGSDQGLDPSRDQKVGRGTCQGRRMGTLGGVGGGAKALVLP